MFKTNHRNTGDSDTMKPGEYECVINRIAQDTTPGGTECITIDLIVRNDYDQKYQNKHIFDRRFLTEKALPYTEQTINQIDILCHETEEEYADYTAWGESCKGKPVRVQVQTEKGTDGYPDRDRVRRYMGSRQPEVRHVYKASAGGPAAPAADPDEDELPF